MRYVIHPGWVKSKTNGELHFISFRRIASLYQVRSEHCISSFNPAYRPEHGDINLRPDPSGRYVIPSPTRMNGSLQGTHSCPQKSPPTTRPWLLLAGLIIFILLMLARVNHWGCDGHCAGQAEVAQVSTVK